MCDLLVVCDVYVVVFRGFFFFKQKTAYELRISDWSSDVCSSDLIGAIVAEILAGNAGLGYMVEHAAAQFDVAGVFAALVGIMVLAQIGRASCRDRVCQYV